jgi:nitrous oxide reductase accessory protein NosL
MAPTIFWLSAVLFAAVIATPILTPEKNLNVPLHPDEHERCPVCGMLVALYPEWNSQVRHGDGSTVFFDGCKDLFKYLLSFDRYAPQKDRKNVTAVYVTNYYDGEVIAARTALFVVGSNVLGPMGSELVPHRSIEAAEDFLKDHNGRQILRFDEITEAVLLNLE